MSAWILEYARLEIRNKSKAKKRDEGQMNDTKSDIIRLALLKAIQSEIERISEEEVLAAGRRTEQRVRESVGQIAATVLNHFEFEKYGTTLRITVDFNNISNITPKQWQQ